MNFDYDDASKAWIARVSRFMSEEIEPAEQIYEAQLSELGRWGTPPVLNDLKHKARSQGLWNLFMPPSGAHLNLDDTFAFEAPGLSNLTYAAIAELNNALGVGKIQ